MVSHTGIEPVTPWLKVKCSTDWANGSYLWGDRRDLNPRQPVPQTGALPTELRSPYIYETSYLSLKIKWSGRRGSNSRHSAWKADALPTELLPQIIYGRCSRIWTYDPLLPRQVRYRAALYTVLEYFFITLGQEIWYHKLK